jgi:purine-binding chemotaxis protein CheW
VSSTSAATEADIRTGGAAEPVRYLTFTLNGEAYALDIFHVTEILEHRHLTVVPMMPDFIRGVINLRGRAVPVIDLAVRFGSGTTGINRRTTIIIVHINAPVAGAGSSAAGQDIGILVDAVNKVVNLAGTDIEPPPAFGAGIRTDYISGMAKLDGAFMIVLEIDHVLSLDDMANLDSVTESGREATVQNAGTTGEAPGEG